MPSTALGSLGWCRVWLALVIFHLPLAFGKPFVHQLFSDDMVLQRDDTDPIWGWTTPGSQVTVEINGQTSSATADSDGRWEASIGPFAAGGPYELSIAGSENVTFSNVMFGDVILYSGQSNMEWIVDQAANASAEVADSINYPNVRCITVERAISHVPLDEIDDAVWQVSGPNTTKRFSAAAYYTAREMYKQQGVPMGIVSSAYGGTVIQSWMNMTTVATIAAFTQEIFDEQPLPADQSSISGMYNGMIAPLSPFRFRGIMWYQGETNSPLGAQYSRLLPLLFKDWRALFRKANMPFIVVQLPNNGLPQTEPVENDGFEEIREAQLRSVVHDSNRSRIVTTIDIGEGELHPPDKQDVGLRASWGAANLLYGQDVVSQGPIPTSFTVRNSSIDCTFSNIGDGLMIGAKNASTPLSPVKQVANGTLEGFVLAGADHVFHFANASITSKNKVSVSAAAVPAPLYVRYAWADNPNATLYNKIIDSTGNVINGIPAGSFRNDPIYELNVTAGTGSTDTYTIPKNVTISADVPDGFAFDHWGGDVSVLASTTTSTTTATVNRIYTAVRAYFKITAAPSISAKAQPGAVIVSWSSLSHVHYSLLRATNESGTYTNLTTGTEATNYTDKYVVDGVTYFYKVVADNEVGTGPQSSAASAIAIGASASGTSATNETAPYAFDGVFSTKWYTADVSSTWIRFNYGNSSNGTIIGGYVLVSANDTAARDPADWQFQGSSNGNSWATLDTETDVTFAGRNTAKAYKINNTQAYQYYRLNISSNVAGSDAGIQLAELSLAEAPSPNGQPLSRLGWNFSASISDTGDDFSALTDGSNSTRWTTGVSQEPDQWLEVDLGGAKLFHEIVLNSGASTGDYPRGYEVHVSNDANTWGSAVASGNGTSAVTDIEFDEQLARWVRITMTGSASQFWTIAELNIY